MSEFELLAAELKALTQGESPNVNTLPMAEDEWYTRPDTVSYGIVSLDFEAGQLHADGLKMDTAYEGSVDLFSMVRSGAGWISLITETLDKHCGGSWNLNSHTYETETGLFHWEWTFQMTNGEVPDPVTPATTEESAVTDGQDGDG